MSSVLRIGLLGVALLLADCTAAAPPSPADPAEEAELATFRRLAFGPPGVVDHGLVKWTQPLRVALIDAESARAQEAARRHLRDLGDLTGLDVAEASGQDANLLIFLADNPAASAVRHRGLYADRVADMRRFDILLERVAHAEDPCSADFRFSRRTGVSFAVVFVGGDRGNRTLHCLVQHTTRTMGLMYDLDQETDSVFAKSGRYTDLTEGDRLMLQLLYDPRLEPGMSWPEVEPLARTVLRDLKRGDS